MRFLADESCDARVAAALRQMGHDVLAVPDTARGASDSVVLDLAQRDRRIVLTEDRDFGRLVFAHDPPRSGGVIYIRCPQWARSVLPESVASLVARHGDALQHSFVVWSPRRVRVRSLRLES